MSIPVPMIFFLLDIRNSALAPKLSIDPVVGMADMGSLVHSRECGKATAVSVPSLDVDLVAEN